MRSRRLRGGCGNFRGTTPRQRWSPALGLAPRGKALGLALKPWHCRRLLAFARHRSGSRQPIAMHCSNRRSNRRPAKSPPNAPHGPDHSAARATNVHGGGCAKMMLANALLQLVRRSTHADPWLVRTHSVLFNCGGSNTTYTTQHDIRVWVSGTPEPPGNIDWTPRLATRLRNLLDQRMRHLRCRPADCGGPHS